MKRREKLRTTWRRIEDRRGVVGILDATPSLIAVRISWRGR
jgi:hypothetical protein